MLAARTPRVAARLDRRPPVARASVVRTCSCLLSSETSSWPVRENPKLLRWHVISNRNGSWRSHSSVENHPRNIPQWNDRSTQQQQHESTHLETANAISYTSKSPRQPVSRQAEQKPRRKSETNRKTEKWKAPQNRWTLVTPVALEKETRRLMQHCRHHQEVTGNDKTKQECLDVMEAWVIQAQNKKDIQSAQRAEALLKTLEEQLKIIPRLECYGAVIRAYASCSNRTDRDKSIDRSEEAADRAECILRHVVKYTPHTLTVHAYNHVFTAWANSGSPSAGERCAALRKLMISTIGDQSDITSIQAEMSAWARSGHPKAPERTLELLLTAVADWTDSQQTSNMNNSTTTMAPTEAMFHTAMGALAKSATQHKQRSAREVAQQLDAIAKLMMDRQYDWRITPTLRTYMMVLGAWERVERVEKRGDAAQRAQSLLEYMIQAATDQEKQQSSLLNTTKAVRIMPTNVSFTSVMVAWCDAEQPDRAEQLYQRLVKLYQTTKHPQLLPTTYVANTFLAGWAKLGRPDRVMEMIRKMQRVAIDIKHPDCQLDLRTFNILLNALGKAKQPNDSLAVLDWLEHHQQKNAAQQKGGKQDKFAAFFNPVTIRGLEQPNDVSYSCVLEILGKSGMVRNAETVLENMKERGIRPSQVAYTSVMLGYSLMEHDPNNVAKAYKIFQEVSATEKPDAVCCTVFINVCSGAQPAERDLALDLALEVYDTLGPRERNDNTYKAMAVAIRNLVVWQEADASSSSRTWSTPAEAESEQKRLIQKIARECCGAGYLSYRVLGELEQVAGRGKIAALMGRDHLHPSWSRNITIPSARPKEV